MTNKERFERHIATLRGMCDDLKNEIDEAEVEALDAIQEAYEEGHEKGLADNE